MFMPLKRVCVCVCYTYSLPDVPEKGNITQNVNLLCAPTACAYTSAVK